METAVKAKSGKKTVQKIGRFLSGMIMPNIGALLAWGLITTLFIPKGWLPNASLATMVGPMLRYIIPLLVGYTAGKQVWGTRGAVIAAIATAGVILGTETPMILGAMLIGPFAGWIIKVFDKAVEGKIAAGFEMLVDNFSVGIFGMILALFGFLVVGPFVAAITAMLTAGANWINNAHLLPGISLFVEPAKILFLNNAINHGIMDPIGVQQVAQFGKSIMFLVETNPGPGLGILLAYWLFGRGEAKATAPGAVIIHFLGGIHEIYFPFVMMNPILLLAVIAGGASGLLVESILGAGLSGPPAPGSIIAVMAMCPKGGWLPVLLGVLVAAAVSFIVAMPFVRKKDLAAEDLTDAIAQTKALKAESKGQAVPAALKSLPGLIAFACDAGMGSSAMGATTLKKRLNQAGLDIPVKHYAIEDIPREATIVVTQATLAERAAAKAPQAQLFTINNFMNVGEYDKLVASLKQK